jgi:hypothetical protein
MNFLDINKIGDIKMRRFYPTVFVLVMIAFTLSVAQDIPNMIYYKGHLANSNGTPISGNKNMTFKIYTSQSGGSKLWEDSYNNVEVNSGVFSVLLGSGNSLPVSVFASGSRFLEIIIGGETLNPRQQIASVPYAHCAASVVGENNVFPSDGNVGIGKINPEVPLDIAGTVAINGFSKSSEGGQLTLMDGDGQGGWEIDNFGSTGDENIRFFRDKGYNDISNALVITNDGMVGIGRANPSQTLDVYGSTQIEDDLVVYGSFKGNLGSSNGAPFPRAAFTSNWTSIGVAESKTVVHGLGGDPENYKVEVQLKHDATGFMNMYIYYSSLNNNSVKVHNFQNDLSPVKFRVRIWIIK